MVNKKKEKNSEDIHIILNKSKLETGLLICLMVSAIVFIMVSFFKSYNIGKISQEQAESASYSVDLGAVNAYAVVNNKWEYGLDEEAMAEAEEVCEESKGKDATFSLIEHRLTKEIVPLFLYSGVDESEEGDVKGFSSFMTLAMRGTPSDFSTDYVDVMVDELKETLNEQEGYKSVDIEIADALSDTEIFIQGSYEIAKRIDDGADGTEPKYSDTDTVKVYYSQYTVNTGANTVTAILGTKDIENFDSLDELKTLVDSLILK